MALLYVHLLCLHDALKSVYLSNDRSFNYLGRKEKPDGRVARASRRISLIEESRLRSGSS